MYSSRFAPGNADFRARGQPVALGARDVVVVVQAAAHVEHRRGAEHARPGHRRARAGVRPRAGEAAVGRPAVDAVEARIEHDGAHEARAIRHLVLVGERVVHLDVESVSRLLARLRLLVVVLADRCARDVGLRNEADQLAGDRADPLLRYLVVRKRNPIGPAEVAGQRVVDPLRDFAEVAVAHPQRRHRRAHDVAEVVDRPLIVAEEEQLAAHDRSAEREPAVGERGRRLQMREVVAGVGLVGVAEEEQAALEIVGAGLQGHVGHRAAGAAELGVVVAGGDADGLERVRRRDDHLQKARLMVVVEAFNQRVVRLPRLAVDLDSQRVLRVEKRGVLAVRACGTGDHDQETLEVPVEGERQLADHLRLEDAARVGPVGLQQRRLGRDGDGLGQLADFQLHVHPDGAVDIHLDVRADDFLEPRQLGIHRVGAVLEARENEVAGVVADGAAADVGLHLGDGHGGAGDARAARVGDVAEQRAGDGLRAGVLTGRRVRLQRSWRPAGARVHEGFSTPSATCNTSVGSSDSRGCASAGAKRNVRTGIGDLPLHKRQACERRTSSLLGLSSMHVVPSAWGAGG